MKKEQQNKKGTKILCALKGTSLCLKPKECNGMDRLCTMWINHSGK